MIDTAILRRQTPVEAITGSILRRASELELVAGGIGVFCHAAYFGYTDARPMWPAFLFASLLLGFVLNLIRDSQRRRLRDEEFADDGLYLGRDVNLFLGVTALQALANFFSMGVFGILIAISF